LVCKSNIKKVAGFAMCNAMLDNSIQAREIGCIKSSVYTAYGRNQRGIQFGDKVKTSQFRYTAATLISPENYNMHRHVMNHDISSYIPKQIINRLLASTIRSNRQILYVKATLTRCGFAMCKLRTLATQNIQVS
jgi:hypothetical protein